MQRSAGGGRETGRRSGASFLRVVRDDGTHESHDHDALRDAAVRVAALPDSALPPTRGAGPRSVPGLRGALDGDETERARQLCLTELDRAARSRAELAALLTRKEVAPDVAEAVLSRFVEAGLIDDAALAESWVSTRQRDKGLSRGTLAQELRRKGVDDEVVAEAVAALDPDVELAAARQLIERKRRSTAGLEPQVRLRRLVGVLARKGYPAGVAFQVVRDVLAEEDAAYGELTVED
jgi:regulatory protein